MEQRMLVFSGNANHALSEKICKYLGVQLGDLYLSRFSDGEVQCQIKENVRNATVFVIQPTCAPSDRNLMDLLVLIDALKRASAFNITAVIPYFGYARQDRKDKPRVPITAKLVADLIATAGAHRVLTVDLHAPQIQGFFNIPVDNLFAAPVLIDYISELKIPDLTIISPDAGGVERARAMAKKLGASLAIIDKRREQANVSEVMNVIGDVRGRHAMIIDDIVDTAGTLCKTAQALVEKGADAVTACCVHPVLSGRAVANIDESPLKKVIVTDTIPLEEKIDQCMKLKVLSVGPLLGEAMKRIHQGLSVSSLFV
jgi:ribose-phosphate pyrophosphokinase